MPWVQTAFTVAYEGSMTGRKGSPSKIWSQDSNEHREISILLLVLGKLEIFTGILIFILTNELSSLIGDRFPSLCWTVWRSLALELVPFIPACLNSRSIVTPTDTLLKPLLEKIIF